MCWIVDSLTQPRNIRFRSNFVQSLNTWHPKHCTNTRSQGQRSRSQRDLTGAKISLINNNSPGIVWSHSFTTYSEYSYMTHDVPQTFKVMGSKVKIRVWHNVSTAKDAVKREHMDWSSSNLAKIIPEPSVTCVTSSRSLGKIIIIIIIFV